jgi:hypothetical protein
MLTWQAFKIKQAHDTKSSSHAPKPALTPCPLSPEGAPPAPLPRERGARQGGVRAAIRYERIGNLALVLINE